MYENTEDLDRLKTSSLVLTVIFSQGEQNIQSDAEFRQDFPRMGWKRAEFIKSFVAFTFPMRTIEKLEFWQILWDWCGFEIISCLIKWGKKCLSQRGLSFFSTVEFNGQSGRII